MRGLTLENIAKVCEGTYFGKEEDCQKEIQGAVIDSRQVEQDYLFIAIKGERVDGHDFAEQVYDQGALCILAEKELKDAKGAYVLVDSTTEAMKKLAAFYRRELDIKVVGITGSVGKTSTKEMIASVIEQKYSVLKTAGNFNNEIGLPLTIFRIRDEHEVAILEMGISDFDEMNRLSTMAYPDYVVITNIGCCHLENLIDRDGVLKAKTESFDHMKENGIAILNGDDDKLITKKSVNGKSAIFYGMNTTDDKAVYATDVENLGFEGMKAKIHTPQGIVDANISIPGEHNVYNAMAATAVGLELGLSLEEIEKGIASAQTIAGRTNFIKNNDMIIIDDCYNANPVSMKASLEVLSHAKGRSIAVLGDMGELGEKERTYHAEVGEAVGTCNIHTLFAAGELAEEYAKAAKQSNAQCEIFYYKDNQQMIDALLEYVQAGDSILVKASHFMGFSEVVKALSEKK